MRTNRGPGPAQGHTAEQRQLGAQTRPSGAGTTVLHPAVWQSSVSFKPLSSAQDGRRLQSIPGCPHHSTRCPPMCVLVYRGVAPHCSRAGVTERLASPWWDTEARSLQGSANLGLPTHKPLLCKQHMTTHAFTGVFFLFKIICPFLLRKKKILTLDECKDNYPSVTAPDEEHTSLIVPRGGSGTAC